MVRISILWGSGWESLPSKCAALDAQSPSGQGSTNVNKIPSFNTFRDPGDKVTGEGTIHQVEVIVSDEATGDISPQGTLGQSGSEYASS